MTATTSTPPDAEHDEGWQAQLSRELQVVAFPARQDELLATLIRHRAPARLLCRLATLSPTRRYTCVTDVLDAVALGAPAS
ncbi:DUF2795 domain-containing protein [Pedococcus sp. 5OH_020]|uniref:DUF2795 domain-containing protein n=1 Tax=Pedococcus sp. 5OH_020 TaxID=2989814 RepID=UPI0022E9FB1A|nr:hypothetical protein [Pedococcus sp. 5OH_020]